MQLEPHYEIRQIIINRQLPGSLVQLTVVIRYRDVQGKQVGPESRQNVNLKDAKLNTRAQDRGRPVWDEDDVLEEARKKLKSTNVKLVEPPTIEE